MSIAPPLNALLVCSWAVSQDACCIMQVVSVLSKKPEVLRLIGVDVHKFTREQILAALKSGQDKCHNEFLAKVSELQLLEEAVASELVRGHHPLLSKPATGSGPTGSSSVSGNTKVAPKARPPQLRSSHAADNAKGGSVLPGMSQHKDLSLIHI